MTPVIPAEVQTQQCVAKLQVPGLLREVERIISYSALTNLDVDAKAQ